jgi:hypothetical protein
VVDLHAPDTGLDPGRVGEVVAAMHHVSATDVRPLDPWYHEPVGADRWDHLVEQLRAAGAPFAGRLAGLRDELVAGVLDRASADAPNLSRLMGDSRWLMRSGWVRHAVQELSVVELGTGPAPARSGCCYVAVEAVAWVSG